MYVEGVTFRRPKIPAAQHRLVSHSIEVVGGSFSLFNVVVDNGEEQSPVVSVSGSKPTTTWKKVSIRSGTDAVSVTSKAHLSLVEASVIGA